MFLSESSYLTKQVTDKFVLILVLLDVPIGEVYDVSNANGLLVLILVLLDVPIGDQIL